MHSEFGCRLCGNRMDEPCPISSCLQFKSTWISQSDKIREIVHHLICPNFRTGLWSSFGCLWILWIVCIASASETTVPASKARLDTSQSLAQLLASLGKPNFFCCAGNAFSRSVSQKFYHLFIGFLDRELNF